MLITNLFSLTALYLVNIICKPNLQNGDVVGNFMSKL